MPGLYSNKIQHVVVLMFENRSFDHMLGGFPGVNGVLQKDGTVNPAFYNTMNPLKPADTSTNPAVLPTVIDLAGQSGLSHDFTHDFGDGMMLDLFGPGTSGYLDGAPLTPPATTYPATGSGFVSTIATNVQSWPPTPNGPSVMYFFEYGAPRIFHQLASEFVVCDNWHCDMPGHTKANRGFMHCATTGNLGIDDEAAGFQVNKTIFNEIEEYGLDWKMYTPTDAHIDSLWLEQIYGKPNAEAPISEFCTDLANGTLPFYSFIMCWSDGSTPETDTSMHPASHIEPGENYLAAIYNKLRSSPYWENTLLVVNFDENGGMYDHVPPPQTVPPDPTQPISTTFYQGDPTEYQFDFTLLGVRIPVLLISPWLSKGVIDSTQYQNTSILRYLEDLMVQPSNTILSLTQRDEKAPSIATVFNQYGLDVMRTDCPENIPGYKGFPFGPGEPDICDPDATKPTAEAMMQPPMQHMVNVANIYLAGLPGHPDSGKPITKTFATNAELSAYAKERKEAANKFFAEKNKK
ncbi:MAG: hypothetical protein JNM88_15785 [Chitinophagaceae bacterium]|nr:hypothetical protein [Chitinophagaceae bacterium]